MSAVDPFVLGQDLAHTPFANVLTTALKQKLTGELLIRHAQGENRIFFKGGHPTGTQVMHSFKPFGRMLIELGLITETQLEASVVEMGKGKRQGEALVAMGALSHEKLEEALRAHQTRNLVEIARLKSGHLTFTPTSVVPSWAAEVSLSALKILRAVLAVPESEPVRQSLFERAGLDSLVVIPPHLVTSTSRFEFTPEEQTALRLLETPMTLKQFFIRSHLPDAQAQSMTAVLLVTSLLVSPERAVPEGAEQLVPRASDEGRERRRRMRERAITNLGGAFAKRPSSPPSRSLLPPADFPEMAEASAPVPSDVALTPDERKLKQLIEDKARLLPTLDAFGKLGIHASATKDQIRTAFVIAAKVFHPDHLPPNLAFVAAQQREVFAAIKEAYDALLQGNSLPPASATSSKPGPPTPTSASKPSGPPRTQTQTQSGFSAASKAREDEARALALQGEQAFKVRDYASAAECFRQAHELAPRGDYAASEAWALYSDPGRRAKQREARELLEKAANAYPDSEKVGQFMGTVLRIEGHEPQALGWLRKAATINPKNGDVANELHLLEMRMRQRK